jgi:hypothetical protein
MMRGEGIKQTKACITTEYENPTKDTWLSLCVGRRDNKFESEYLSYAQYVHKLYCDTKSYVKRKFGGNQLNFRIFNRLVLLKIEFKEFIYKMEGQLVQKTFALDNIKFDCWVIKIGHKFWFKAHAL